MNSWKWYSKKYMKDPLYRLTNWKIERLSKKDAKKIAKRVRHARQFEKEHGFAFEDCWNLDNAIAKFLYPRLAYLRDKHMGVPGTLDAQFEHLEDADAEWTRILDVMTRGFYLYSLDEEYYWTEEDKELWADTLSYFTQYFSALWD